MNTIKWKRIVLLGIILSFCIWLQAWLIGGISVTIVCLSFVPAIECYFVDTYNRQNRMIQKILDWLCIFMVSLAIVVSIKSFLFDVFRLPSNSMEKTIDNGDLIVINKLIFGPRIHADSPNKYHRCAGWLPIRRNDLIVFNFPEGDTLLVNRHTESYYSLRRTYGKMKASDADQFLGEKAFKSVSRRPKYIKRVIALPGDSLTIREGVVFVNNQPVPDVPGAIRKYVDASGKGDSVIRVLGVKPYNQYLYKSDVIYEFDETSFHQYPQLKEHIQPLVVSQNMPDPHVFPYNFTWNTDCFGPVHLPRKGEAIALNAENIALYARLIDVYEENDLEIKGKQIFINGKPADTYLCKMNYYWVMGDNHPHSFDSRYWGFLPENHIIGISPLQIHL